MHFPIYSLLAFFYALSQVAAGHSSVANSHARRSIDVRRRQLLGDNPVGGLLNDLGLPVPNGSPSSSSSSDPTPSSSPSSSDPPASTTDATSSSSAPDTAVTPASSSSSGGGLLSGLAGGVTSVLGDVTSVLAPSSTSLPSSTSSSSSASDSGTPTSASTPTASSSTGGLPNPLTSILDSVLPATTTQAPSDTPTTDPTIPSSSESSSTTPGILDPVTSVLSPVTSALLPSSTTPAADTPTVPPTVSSSDSSPTGGPLATVGSILSSVADPVTSILLPPTTTQPSIDTPTVPPTISSPGSSPTTDPLATVNSVIASAADPVTSILLPPTTTQPPIDTPTIPPTVLPPSSSSDGVFLSSFIPAISSVLLGATSVLPAITDEPSPSSVPSDTVPTAVSSFIPAISSVLPGTTSVLPAITDEPPLSSVSSDTVPTAVSPSISAASSAPVITFPDAVSSTIVVNPNVTIPSTSVVPATVITVDPGLSFVLTETSLAFASIPTTSAAVTITDPDQVTTTELLPTAATAATTLSVAPLPTGIPARIYPRDQIDTNALEGFTLISILFNQELNWPFVVGNAVSSSQIFAYIPVLITTALGISSDQVKTWALQVYVPTTYHTPADSVELGTMWLGYIPTQYVDTLAAEIKAKQSKFYTGVPDNVAQSLADRVNSGFSLLSVADPNSTVDGGSGPSATGSTGDNGQARQDAIIGVVSALGAIAVLILVFLVYRSMKRRKQLAHHRLSDPPGTQNIAGVRPEGREFDQDSVGGARRRSFYYAEDSLRGFQEHREADEVFDITTERRTNPQMVQRKTITPGAISAPVLRESSMNW